MIFYAITWDKQTAILYFEITKRLPPARKARIIAERDRLGRILASKVPQIEYPRLRI